MSDQETPIGKRFSHVNFDRPPPLKDSPKSQIPIGSFCGEKFWRENDELGKWLKQEMGLPVPRSIASFPLDKFFLELRTEDMLDAITVVYRFFHRGATFTTDGVKWQKFVTRALQEENMGYRLDDECGVHYLVDEEFEKNRTSLLSCLDKPRYAGVLAAFEDAHKHFDSSPPDTKAAVRSMFESLEILFKQMTKKSRLASNLVKTDLSPIVLGYYQGNDTAISVSEKFLQGLGEWIDGVHFYRHGQGEPEPVEPPLGLAIHILSSGASFLRWLVEIDKSRE